MGEHWNSRVEKEKSDKTPKLGTATQKEKVAQHLQFLLQSWMRQNLPSAWEKVKKRFPANSISRLLILTTGKF